MALEKIYCPICDNFLNNSPKEIFKDPWFGNIYKYYECPSCDVGFWEPRKIIPEFYEKEYLSGYSDLHKGKPKKLKYYHKEFFSKFYENLHGLRVLDIGCGNGLFLKEVEAKGAEAWGIDIDSKSIEFAKKNLGLKNVYAFSLSDFFSFAQKSSLYFNIISFFEVLEHQDHPTQFLAQIYTLLKENGYIIGTVPNRKSFTAQKAPESYVDYPPNHFFRFSSVSIKRLLQKLNFKDIEVINLVLPLGKYLKELDEYVCRVYFNNLSKIFLKFLFGSTNKEIRREIRGIKKRIYKISRFVKAIFLRPILLPIALGYKSRMNHPTLLFIARK